MPHTKYTCLCSCSSSASPEVPKPKLLSPEPHLALMSFVVCGATDILICQLRLLFDSTCMAALATYASPKGPACSLISKVQNVALSLWLIK